MKYANEQVQQKKENYEKNVNDGLTFLEKGILRTNKSKKIDRSWKIKR